MATIGSKKATASKGQYNPNTDYRWEETDEFVLSGPEFSLLFNTCRAEVFNPAGISLADKISRYDILNKKFLEGIEAGVIVPKEPEEKKNGAMQAVKEEAPE